MNTEKLVSLSGSPKQPFHFSIISLPQEPSVKILETKPNLPVRLRHSVLVKRRAESLAQFLKGKRVIHFQNLDIFFVKRH